MTQLSLRVPRQFGEMGKDRLDLHVPFEPAGNEPAARKGVREAFDELTGGGLLDACGGVFYALTERSKGAISQS